MKIGKPADKPPVPVGTNGTPGTVGSAPPTAPNAPASAIPAHADPSATIALSPTASSLLSGDVHPEFDAKKVSQVSAAIDNGTYRINPGAIADKLISNATELLSQAQS